jgi:hypothetical protein
MTNTVNTNIAATSPTARNIKVGGVDMRDSDVENDEYE